ncbi:ASCH domain-containing protein [Slackia heliotrinireducens]|uniref:ASCH domain-containing protein n=1 Tax=Slackia heliotrinireducens TaxID=84110 RepID=UPI00331538FF
MKALSVRPPWALQILVGAKTVECRSWKTPYRGQLLICSSTNDHWAGTIAGHALCVVNLKDIVPFKKKHLEPAGMTGMSVPKDHYAWILDDLDWIEPFPQKGKLHLFDVDDALIKSIPEEVSCYDTFAKYYMPLAKKKDKYDPDGSNAKAWWDEVLAFMKQTDEAEKR